MTDEIDDLYDISPQSGGEENGKENHESGSPGDPDVKTGNEGGPDNGIEPANDPNITEKKDQAGSVINKFLETYNIQGGKIRFEDGGEVLFKDLDEGQQLEILKNIVAHNTQSVEEQYGLTEEEVAVLNLSRKTGKSFDEIIETLVRERMQENELRQHFGDPVNYKEMTADDIYRKFLKDQNPGISDEEINTDLEIAKKIPNYESTTNYLRNQFGLVQDAERNKWIEDRRNKDHASLEEDRQNIVESVIPLKEVAGWELSDLMKNEVLADILEVDENGQSPFMKEVLGDPQKLFQAAWLMKYAEDYFNKLDAYYQNELKKVTSAHPKKNEPNPEPRMNYNRKQNPLETKTEKTVSSGVERTLDDLYN